LYRQGDVAASATEEEAVLDGDDFSPADLGFEEGECTE